MWHAKIKGDLFGHPKFQLSDDELKSFEMFMRDSKELGIL